MNKRLGLTALLSAAVLAGCGAQPSASLSPSSPAQSSTLGAQGAGKPSTGTSTAAARVFVPNPVQSTGDQSLTDGKDAASAVPQSAYKGVTLRNLDGSGFLRGDWAVVVSETGTPAYGTSFNFDRSQDQFEQVMAYFWITEAQLYLQSLGFGSELPAVNRRQQAIRVGQWGQDNSFQTDKQDEIRMGKGGVDDAEDGEVIVHEYGHAVHAAQVPGFGSSLEAGSIGEAFGDYLAVIVGQAVARREGVAIRAPLACVADWDSVSYTSTAPHCLRRMDTGKHYPEDVRGQVHADGEIWSQALLNIRTALGERDGDRVIINAQFRFAPDTSFAAAAQATVDTARDMLGTAAAGSVRQVFVARGILK